MNLRLVTDSGVVNQSADEKQSTCICIEIKDNTDYMRRITIEHERPILKARQEFSQPLQCN